MKQASRETSEAVTAFRQCYPSILTSVVNVPTQTFWQFAEPALTSSSLTVHVRRKRHIGYASISPLTTRLRSVFNIFWPPLPGWLRARCMRPLEGGKKWCPGFVVNSQSPPGWDHFTSHKLLGGEGGRKAIGLGLNWSSTVGPCPCLSIRPSITHHPRLGLCLVLVCGVQSIESFIN